MNRFKRIIIFGHSGFIGSHLVGLLAIRHPALPVIGCSDPKVDLTDMRMVDRISRLFGQDTAVVMLSAIKPNIADDQETCWKNIAMVTNVCRALSSHPVGRLIYMSSAAVYGEDIAHLRITEETPVSPRSYYGIAKYTSERLLWKTFAGVPGSSLLVLRPPVVYGPGEGATGYNPSGFLQKAMSGETITLWGDGKERREFIYIDDMAAILHFFLFHKTDGTVNIASGKSYSFAEVVTVIQKLLGPPISVASRSRSKKRVDHQFDNALLKRLAPHLRFTSLFEGLSKTYDTMHRV